jgi:cob(I)alamin adenosyltransferase
MPGHSFITQAQVEWLEQELDALNDDLPMLKEFILPGGSLPAATCHIARTVCRRAERLMVSLAREEPVEAAALAFVNRLSDYLFVAARVLARETGGEVLWRGR